MQLAVVRLFSHFDLLLAWTLRIIKARYQQSVLGGLWAIIQPLATVAMFSVIFTLFIPIDTDRVPYLVFSFAAMVPWTLFAGSVGEMVNSLVNNMNLVSKIYFPREILPIAALLARLLDFGIAFGLLFFMLIYYQMPLFTLGWLYLPLILMTQLALSLGVGLAGAAMNVFFRDVTHIIVLGLQLWFYATPIIYPISVVPKSMQSFYFLNPMAGVIEAYRSVLLYGEMPGSNLLISASMALLILLAGYLFFKRVEFQFADVI